MASIGYSYKISDMKGQWLDWCVALMRRQADLYSGCRKILRGVKVTFSRFDDSLQMSDAGYTSNKMRMLEKNYLHHESRRIALKLWARRREAAKYGSVSFTTFAHFVKGKGTLEEIVAKKSKRASVFGPCIQSVIITLLNKNEYAIDVPYRTTEFLKKFPADLVFLRELLKPFNFRGLQCAGITFHFTNVTVHPMYAVTVIPHLEDPIHRLNELKKEDKYFFNWVVKWTARYVCPEYHRGIAKFAQAQRVKMHALKELRGSRLKALQKYLRANHPGHRNVYEEDDDD